MLVRLTARETFPYDGVTRFKGASFNAPDHDAAILQMIGKADATPDDAPVANASTADPVAEPERTRRGRRPHHHSTDDTPPAA